MYLADLKAGIAPRYGLARYSLYICFFPQVLAGPLVRRWAVPALAALWVGVDITFGSIGFQWVTLGNAASNMSIPMRLAP